METLVFNFGGTTVRTEVLEGIEYWVAPMVMAVEGVLDGSDGPIFYAANELSKSPSTWDHKPIIVYHAEKDGEPVSGCSPDVIEKQKIGIIMNTEWDGRLFSEAWIDKKKVGLVDVRVENAIKHGVRLEVSTGLFIDQVDSAGEFRGKKYSKSATNIRPDHLAILPDQIGACSLADGAGFLVNQKHPVVNALSFSAIRSRLYDLLRAKYASASSVVDGDCWYGYVEDVYPDYVIFTSNEDGLFKIGYSIDKKDKVSLTGEAEPVIRVVSYQLTSEAVDTKSGVSKMATNSDKKTQREARVTAIITANTGWTEAEREYLTEMDESPFRVLEKNALATQNVPVPTPTPAPEKTVETQQTTMTTTPRQMSAAEYIAAAPPEIREVLNNGLSVHNREKARLVSLITANKKNRFSAEYLNSRPIEELAGIAELAAPAVTENQQSVNMFNNYAGVQGTSPVTNATAEEEEPLALPTMNFE